MYLMAQSTITVSTLHWRYVCRGQVVGCAGVMLRKCIVTSIYHGCCPSDLDPCSFTLILIAEPCGTGTLQIASTGTTPYNNLAATVNLAFLVRGGVAVGMGADNYVNILEANPLINSAAFTLTAGEVPG